MVIAAGTRRVAHAFSMPRQAHGLLIHLGWREFGYLATVDLGTDVAALDRLSIDFANLDLTKESFVELGVVDRTLGWVRFVPGGREATAIATSAASTSKLAQEIRKCIRGGSPCSGRSQAAHERGIVSRRGRRCECRLGYHTAERIQLQVEAEGG